MTSVRATEMEHRWGVRRPIDLDVRVVGQAGRIAPGWLRDLSLSGAFVRTPLVAPVMSTVRVLPRYRAEGWPPQRELLAYVVRVDARGLGLEWWEIWSDRNMLDR